jgi:dTDP-4-dehydrorhamnose reductase
MRILITGGNGFLGQYLNLELAKRNEILTLYNQLPRNCKNFNSLQTDIRDYKILNQIFDSFKPEVVIHTASISTPQKADAVDTKTVYHTNVKSSENLAKLCEHYKSKLIYTSTDLVYAGYRGSLLKEDAKLNPISLYAETKLMGEEKIKSTFDNYIILRTALMFGFGLHGTTCFFHKMYDKLKAGEKVKVFYDQYRSPLSVIEAARIIRYLCESEIKDEIINFGGPERLSRYELTEMLCKTARFDKTLLDKISMRDLPNLPHVTDISMNLDKLKSLGYNFRSVDDALDEILFNTSN